MSACTPFVTPLFTTPASTFANGGGEGSAVGASREGLPPKGRRGSGTFIVHITRDTSKSGQASLPAPERAK